MYELYEAVQLVLCLFIAYYRPIDCNSRAIVHPSRPNSNAVATNEREVVKADEEKNQEWISGKQRAKTPHVTEESGVLTSIKSRRPRWRDDCDVGQRILIFQQSLQRAVAPYQGRRPVHSCCCCASLISFLHATNTRHELSTAAGLEENDRYLSPTEIYY